MYTLSETGTASGGVFSQGVVGTDNYSGTDASNSAAQTDVGTTSGGGTWTRTSSGPGSTLASGSGTNSYVLSTTGNAIAGVFGESETGTDRYRLVQKFDDASNATSGQTPGNVTFHSHGLMFRDPNSWGLPTWDEVKQESKKLVDVVTPPEVKQFVQEVQDKAAQATNLSSDPVQAISQAVIAVSAEKIAPSLMDAGRQIGNALAPAFENQAKNAHAIGEFLKAVETAQEQAREIENPGLKLQLDAREKPRRADLAGRAGHSTVSTLFGGGNPLVDGAIGLLKAGAALSESANENMGLALRGKSDQAERQSSAFVGGYVEGSMFTGVAKWKEEFSVDLPAFLEEQSSGKLVSNEELQKREAEFPQLREIRTFVEKVGLEAEMNDPRHRKLGQTAAPFIDQLILSVLSLPFDIEGLVALVARAERLVGQVGEAGASKVLRLEAEEGVGRIRTGSKVGGSESTSLPKNRIPLKDTPVTLQPTSNTCVSTSLDMMLEHHAPGRLTTNVESYVGKLEPKGLHPVDATIFITDNLEKAGLRVVRSGLDDAIGSGQPFIAYVNEGLEGHAVFVQGVREVNGVKHLIVKDPAKGAYLEPVTDFESRLVRNKASVSFPTIRGEK